MKKGKRTITPYDDYNSRIPHKREWDFIGTITPNCGTLAIRNGWKIIPLNTTNDGLALALVSGYYKFGTKNLLDWKGTTGTCIMEIYEEERKDG